MPNYLDATKWKQHSLLLNLIFWTLRHYLIEEAFIFLVFAHTFFRFTRIDLNMVFIAGFA